MLIRRVFSALRILRLNVRSAAVRTYLLLAHPAVSCHRTVQFGRGVTIRAFDGGRIVLGAGTVVLENAQVQTTGGVLIVGKNCQIGRGAVVFCTDHIEIGEGTMIAEHVTIRDHNHRHEGEGRLELQGHVSAPIHIGDNVWLGAKVTVTKGVDIAPRAVVGANAVVTRSLPSRGVYGGIPARLLKRVEK